MDEFHRQAVALSLKKMFQGRHFDITPVRSALEVLGAHMNSKDEAALRALHCVDFKDMTPELRQMLFAKVMEVINSEPMFNVDLITNALGGFHATLLN